MQNLFFKAQAEQEVSRSTESVGQQQVLENIKEAALLMHPFCDVSCLLQHTSNTMAHTFLVCMNLAQHIEDHCKGTACTDHFIKDLQPRWSPQEQPLFNGDHIRLWLQAPQAQNEDSDDKDICKAVVELLALSIGTDASVPNPLPSTNVKDCPQDNVHCPQKKKCIWNARCPEPQPEDSCADGNSPPEGSH